MAAVTRFLKPFLDLDLFINNGIVSSKIYDKRDDFDFSIINYPNLDSDVPRSTSYGVYISQLIRFARACTSVEDFHIRNQQLPKSFLSRGTDIINFVKHFLNSFTEIFLSLTSINVI